MGLDLAAVFIFWFYHVSCLQPKCLLLGQADVFFPHHGSHPMLKGLSPLLSADLLHALASMGHGDDIVLADANFPSATHAKRLIRMPGVGAAEVLDAVLSVMPLDTFVDAPALTMQVVGDAQSTPPAVADFNRVLTRHGAQPASSLERFAFYERAAQAFAVIATGETRVYGNIILRKGVVLHHG